MENNFKKFLIPIALAVGIKSSPAQTTHNSVAKAPIGSVRTPVDMESLKDQEQKKVIFQIDTLGKELMKKGMSSAVDSKDSNEQNSKNYLSYEHSEEDGDNAITVALEVENKNGNFSPDKGDYFYYECVKKDTQNVDQGIITLIVYEGNKNIAVVYSLDPNVKILGGKVVSADQFINETGMELASSDGLKATVVRAFISFKDQSKIIETLRDNISKQEE